MVLLYLSLTLIDLLIFWFSMGADQVNLIAENAVLSARSTGFELVRRLAPLRENLTVTPGKVSELLGDAASGALVTEWDLYSATGMSLKEAGNAPYPPGRLLKAMQAREYYGQAFTVYPDLLKAEVAIVVPLGTAGAMPVLVARLPAPALRSQVNAMIRSGALLSAVLLLMQALFGFLLYRRYARPLLELVRSVVSFPRHEKVPVQAITRSDEIGYLEFAFTRMAASLAAGNEKLRQATQQAQSRQKQLEFDLELGRTIQNAIMPQSWQSPQAEVRIFFRPLEQVSGDYYDFFNFADGRLGILLADAMGHGVPAALVTMMTKVHFTNLVEQVSDPAGLLIALHRQMRKIPLGLSYLTAVYFVLQRDLSFSYAVACHMPVMLLSKAEKRVRLLQGHGFLLGLDNREAIDCISGRLAPGDRLLFFTDGLIEPGQETDSVLGNVQQVFLAAAELSLTDCYEYLIMNLVTPHPERSDDITFVLVEAKAAD